MIFNFPNCDGCKNCELACSFYHSGEFNPSNSSIKIIENKDKHKGGFLINFLENKDEFVFQCDGCLKTKESLCLQYCQESGKLKRMIYKFINRSKS